MSSFPRSYSGVDLSELHPFSSISSGNDRERVRERRSPVFEIDDADMKEGPLNRIHLSRISSGNDLEQVRERRSTVFGKRPNDDFFPRKQVVLNKQEKDEETMKKNVDAIVPPESLRAADRNIVPLIKALNTKPMLAIFFVILTVFVPLSLFLDQYVAEAKHSLAMFAVGSYMVWSSYFSFHYHLKRYSSSYRRIPLDKQFYVLSNFIKSALLLSYSPLAASLLYEVIVHDQWNVQRIWNLGCMYAIPDFVSLILVKRMASTTIAHHVCVCIFMVVSLNNDYKEDGICQSIVIYAIWSDFAYLVNLLLASRFMNIEKHVSMYLSVMAGVIYFVCCCINWTWQVGYMKKLILTPGIYSVYLYIPMLGMIIRDDVVLLKWLYSNATKKRWEMDNTSDGSSSAVAASGKKKRT